MDQNLKTKNGYLKVYNGIKLMQQGWIELGLDKTAPEEFENLKSKGKKIGDAYGWK